MKFAYADPPYLGCGKLYDAHHSESRTWDDPTSHKALVERLCDEYKDGWALSLSSPSLHVILPFVRVPHRIGAWVKPFAAFKPNVNPAYAWEPVIFSGGRRRGRDIATCRDWVSCNITLKKGLTGAKPEPFCTWVLDVLNVQTGDTFDDLFPGTGVMSRLAAARVSEMTFDIEGLF